MSNISHSQTNNHNALGASKYRSDIDGLRAVAILLVVIFHAFNFGGGFIGVDIFFVISGFLISTIIFNTLNSGTFSFADFYSRRIRRIFPALLTVLISILIFGWFALFPDEFKQLNQHIFRGSYFVSNFHLLKESGDYFDTSSDHKPLLHLWSLAIEEQFYIIWPLLLWCAWKRKLSILRITILIAAVSFIFGLPQTFQNKTMAFYLPQSRFWELLIGSILAHLNSRKQNFATWLSINLTKKISEKTLLNALSILGFSLISIATITITKEKYFPGAWALLPTFGATLIIFAGSDAWINRKILQNSILIWFGLISFPLYLWHWPMLAFARIIEGQTPEIFIRIIAVLTSIFLAWITYKFIEKPIRFGNNSIRKTIALIVVMALLGCLSHDLYKKKRPVYQKNSRDLSRPDKAIKSNGSCDKFKMNLKGTTCLTNSEKPEILVIGDSHSMSLNSAAFLGEVNLNTLLIAANRCLPFDKYLAEKKFESDDCRNLAAQIKIAVKEIKSIKAVLISTYSPEQKDFAEYGFADANKTKPEDIFLNGYSDFIAELIAADKNVIFVIDVPKLPFNPKACVTRIFNKKPSSDCRVKKDFVLKQEAIYRKIVSEIKRKNPQLKLFDSAKILCDENYCYGKDSENIFYWDENHLSISGSRKLLNNLIKQEGL